jgi:Sulfotransferase family
MGNLQVSTNIGRRYVFVCGLHRSGTSLLGRNIARLENCTGFNDTGVTEDEGQFLQDIYPISKVYGGAGRFGFDPRAHLTETSSLLTPENAAKLRQSWERYWDQAKGICVEKTPGNLLKTRFLQAMFPQSYFIVIRRHPISVSMANQKWKGELSAIHKLFEHWLHCHALLDEDKKHLKHVYELSYENYVQDPGKYHAEIATFIGSSVPEDLMEQVTGAYNQKYFSRWSELLNKSALKGYYRFVAAKYEPMFAKYGYSLTRGFGVNEEQVASRTGAAAGALYCLLADANAMMIRLTTRSKGYIKRQLRARLPASLKVRIKEAVEKPAELKSPPTIASS